MVGCSIHEKPRPRRGFFVADSEPTPRATYWNGKVHNFDYGNRLRSVTDVESYRYDAHGRRIRAWTPSAGLLYSLYSQAGQLLWQRDARSNKRREYVYLNGSLVAERTRPLSGSTETITYQHTDALGTPVLKTSASRVILERREYEPYGKLLNQPMASGPGFTGHDTDPATQYTYMQQRYYDPRVGRFWSVDPVTVDSAGGNFNRYWYGNNNPYRFTDPDGRQVAVPWGQIGEVAAKRGSQAAIASQLDSPVPGPGDVVGAIILVSAIVEIGHTVWQANQEGDAPALPDGLVGNDQTPRGSGNCVTSGTLSSDFGGTGDYDADLETLAGETRPAGPGDNAPSGAQIGTNGVFGRENSSGGRSIDIPANGDKPHETLHYPREEK